MTKREEKIRLILSILKQRWPTPGAMEIGNAYMAVVAVALSARTRDEQVLKLMPGFFEVYPSPVELARATADEIESKINTIGMYRQKARNLQKMAKRVEVYDGEIPDSMEDLTSLAGVGRKTASVILPYIFGKPAIAVDTHVHRVTNRLGWVKTGMPADTEKSLLKIVPEDVHPTVNRVFVKHGRYVCIAKPRCWACPIADMCPFKAKNLDRPKDAEDILADIERREQVVQEMRERVDGDLS
jgi:endonuclease-3